jgi:hypothetical protein
MLAYPSPRGTPERRPVPLIERLAYLVIFVVLLVIQWPEMQAEDPLAGGLFKVLTFGLALLTCGFLFAPCGLSKLIYGILATYALLSWCYPFLYIAWRFLGRDANPWITWPLAGIATLAFSSWFISICAREWRSGSYKPKAR